MKRAFFIFLLTILMICPASFANDEEKLPNIFIWSTPAINTKPTVETDDENADASDSDYLSEEDITARNQKRDAALLNQQEKLTDLQKKQKNKKDKDDSIPLVQVSDEDTLSATTLKGYAEYKNGINDVYLLNPNNEFVLNIRKPQRVTATSINLQKSNIFQKTPINMSKFNAEEYKISSLSSSLSEKVGKFEFGTTYGSDLDTSELEYSTGLFAKYKYKKLSLATAYTRTLGTTYGSYSDTFYLAPGIKINDIFSIKEILSADMTYNRKSSELVFTVTPFGKSGNDRLNFELGAKQSFDINNTMYKTQVRFSTMFKL